MNQRLSKKSILYLVIIVVTSFSIVSKKSSLVKSMNENFTTNGKDLPQTNAFGNSSQKVKAVRPYYVKNFTLQLKIWQHMRR
jgi:hypothetical protein